MCIRCDNTISNPLCNICLAERMVLSVSEQDPKLAGFINGFKVEGETKCISCGEKTGLCANCFSRDIYEFLTEKNPAVAKSFLGQFDYGLRKDVTKLF